MSMIDARLSHHNVAIGGATAIVHDNSNSTDVLAEDGAVLEI